MANAWQVRFEPTIVALTPQRGGNFNFTQTQPGAPAAAPPGSFQVVIAVKPRLSETNNGPSPLAPGAKSPATLEFIGRARPQAAGQTAPFISMGVLRGTVDFNTSGAKPVPRFTAGTKAGPGNSLDIDFTAATNADVLHSDWALRILKDPDTFDTNVVTSFFVLLPWQFVENPGKMQLSARLRIAGTIAADESRNTLLDLPLRHLKVPEDANTQLPPLTFFGVRNLYTKSNAKSLPRVPLNNNNIRLILHSTFTDFCTRNTRSSVAEVIDKISQILFDAGFSAVDFLRDAPALADCNLHWKRVGGHFMGRKITDPDPSKSASDPTRLENRLAAAISANNISSITIPSGMEEVIPFFDFYIFAEDADPPVPTELAHSETGVDSLLSPSAATKALFTPIIIAKGSSSSSPLPKLLGQIDPADHGNVLATTVCHEIGHSFGLRHAVSFIDQPPYLPGDARFARGTMGLAGLVLGSGTPRIPLGFFGPVHVEEIKRLFL